MDMAMEKKPKERKRIVHNKSRDQYYKDQLSEVVSLLLDGCTIYTLTKHLQKNVRWEPYKDDACCFELILGVATYKTAAV